MMNSQYAVMIRNDQRTLLRLAKGLARERVSLGGIVSERLGDVAMVRLLGVPSGPRVRRALRRALEG